MPKKKKPPTLRRVKPAEPIAGWTGGKRNLSRRIVARINATPHDCYAEPFCGMAGVFFRRERRPKSEAINDINGDVVNLFRVVREHPQELLKQFDFRLASRAEYSTLLETPLSTLTDVQRAARFVYLQRLTFGGSPAHLTTPGNFIGDPWGRSKFRPEVVRKLIVAAHNRLQGVNVECLEWHELIRRYDKPFTLFYIDPPYWGYETDYGKDIFARSDFARLAELLGGIRGRFILSLNDRPEVRETFADFKFEEVQTTYTTNAKEMKPASELLISN